MPWKIIYHPKVETDFEKNVAPKDREFIFETIEKRLSEEPDKVGKPLRHELSEYRRLRISKYRVIYQVKKHTITVFVLTVDRREDVYADVFRRLGL